MRRAENDSSELPGQDSFLDIVANIVGILILLVMVVGLRAAMSESQSEADSSAENQAAAAARPSTEDALTESPITAEQLDDKVRAALASRTELQTKIVKAVNMRKELQQRDDERVELTTFVAAIEQEIEEQRQKMGEDQRRDFDLRTKLSAAEQELEQLSRERIALLSAEPEVEQVESLPTPLAATVSSAELHVRLAEGHAKLIPLDELLAAAKQNARENVWRLDTRDVAELSIGPIDGFRMRYVMRKYAFSSSRGTGIYVGSAGWELEPETPVLGEPIEQAVQPSSQLMSGLARLGVGKRPTVTVWTYPDSFNEFRELKRALFEAGFSVAGRPLPAGKPIGGSPRGTKSAAQ